MDILNKLNVVMLTTSSIVNFYKHIKSTILTWHDQADDKLNETKLKWKAMENYM
jgi:hypothetical protein